MKAQDIHFSQFAATKISLNPALVGRQSEDHKLILQKRTQWESVADPFSTFSISFETKDLFFNIPLGVQFLNDVAGDANFTTSQFNFAISQPLKIDEYRYFAIGTVLGLAQRKVDYTNLLFEEQEDLQNPKFMFFDFGLGGNFTSFLNENSSFIIGLGVYHLNRPKQSLLGEDNVFLPEKYNYYVISFFPFNNTLTISPSLFYSRQGNSNEFIFGSKLNQSIQGNKIELIGELLYRWRDAVIPSFGIRHSKIIAMISYDINISDLIPASRYKGGFEFSISYRWSRKKSHHIKETKKYCPKYL